MLGSLHQANRRFQCLPDWAAPLHKVTLQKVLNRNWVCPNKFGRNWVNWFLIRIVRSFQAVAVPRRLSTSTMTASLIGFSQGALRFRKFYAKKMTDFVWAFSGFVQTLCKIVQFFSGPLSAVSRTATLCKSAALKKFKKAKLPQVCFEPSLSSVLRS